MTSPERFDDARRYEQIVARHGFSLTHKQAFAWVPDGARVLEIGCATGYMGAVLQNEKGCRVTGIEIDPAAAVEARHKGLEVIVGSLEDAAFRRSIPRAFDAIVATDVIEHLRDPRVVLADFARWLVPGGMAVVAVPNVATWTMRAQLMFRGDFDYQDEGILDHTHLRFFTWNSIHALLAELGFHVEERMVEGWELPGTEGWLLRGPLDLRRRYEQERPGGVRGGVTRVAYHAAGKLLAARERALRVLGPRFPNLCARHIALLLRPPASEAAT